MYAWIVAEKMWPEFVDAYTDTLDPQSEFPVSHTVKTDSIYNRFILFFDNPLVNVNVQNSVEIAGHFYFRVYLTPIFNDLILNEETVLLGLNTGDLTDQRVIRQTVIDIIISFLIIGFIL